MEALGINLPGLITQVVSFTVLLALLYTLLYKPILSMLDQRSKRIRESLETAERVRKESAQSQQEMQAQLETARNEGQELIAQARKVAERYREEELAKAREEIQLARSRAEANIQKERDAAIEELRREFSGLAISAAERIVEKSLDESTHGEIIDKVLEESSRIPSN